MGIVLVVTRDSRGILCEHFRKVKHSLIVRRKLLDGSYLGVVEVSG